MELQDKVDYIKGIGEKRAKLFNKLNIFSVKDLIEFLPKDYIKKESKLKIADLKADENISIVLKLIDLKISNISYNKRKITAYFSDDKNILICAWFNSPTWLLEKLKINTAYWISGVIKIFNGQKQIVHPEFEDFSLIKEDFWKKKAILPVYQLTSGLTQNNLRNAILKTSEKYFNKISETLPTYLLEKYAYDDLQTTFQKIHFPDFLSEKPKERLIFEEFFYLQLLLAQIRKNRIIKQNGIAFVNKKIHTTALKNSLPFSLTSSQIKVINEIFSDMCSAKKMDRLLQGEVGSGKTIVVLFAMLLAVENSYQAALLAPTEILAVQHYESIKNLTKLKIAYLKGGNYKGKKEVLEKIKNGEYEIIIGTHALFQEKVLFSKLGLVVIDEQHRFGVKQRHEMNKKGFKPDVLHLSATPIPRSLALTFYGDLDISIINSLPQGRKPIKTINFISKNLNKLYLDLEVHLKEKKQIFVVCPLIEESEKIKLVNANDIYLEYSKIFSKYKCGLIHGKMKTEEKDQVMEAFKNKEIDILVATTVIEVGINIPNANVILIHHADRFGLSQLHQLRGRVGRGNVQAYCYLISYLPISDMAKKRLKIFSETLDGFVLANQDLKFRGPGDFLGTKQSGLPDFKFANLLTDQKILETAKKEASLIIEDDPGLAKEKNKILKRNCLKLSCKYQDFKI